MKHPLSNQDIDKILTNHPQTRDVYKGYLFPRDEDIQSVLKNIKIPALYVINTDYIKGPGKHWVLVLYRKDLTLFFDPFGLSEDVHKLNFVVERKNNDVLRNTFTVQDFHSRSFACGHFVILYAIHLAKGRTRFKRLNSKFTKNTPLNDSIAIDTVQWLNSLHRKKKMFLPRCVKKIFR